MATCSLRVQHCMQYLKFALLYVHVLICACAHLCMCADLCCSGGVYDPAYPSDPHSGFFVSQGTGGSCTAGTCTCTPPSVTTHLIKDGVSKVCVPRACSTPST